MFQQKIKKGSPNKPLKSEEPFFSSAVQPKLKMGQKGDQYEQEADKMADKVVHENNANTGIQKKSEEEVQQKPLASEITPFVQKMDVDSEESIQQMKDEEEIQKIEEEESVQKKEEDELQLKEDEEVQQKSLEPSSKSTTTFQNKLKKGSGGKKMDPATQSEMETGFGTSFEKVRIHDNTEAQQMSQAIGAKAFTNENDIYFNKGTYNPSSKAGKHLLAHELTHTIQQKGMIQKKDQPEQDQEPNAKVKLGRKIMRSMSKGQSIIFYETDDSKFKESQQWAKTHGSIGFEGNQITAENIVFGKAIEERVTVKGENDGEKRQLSIANVIAELGELLKQSVIEAYQFDNTQDGGSLNQNWNPLDWNPLDFGGGTASNMPPQGILDLAKFKTVALGSHGYDIGEGETSLDIGQGNIGTFIESTSSYLRNDVNVIFYSCTVAKSADEDYDQWMRVYNEDGGETSLVAMARDKLAELGHTEGQTWGHTAAGHFLENYTLRRFLVKDAGQKGESFLLICFKEEIDTMVNAVITALNADPEFTQEIDDIIKEAIWNEVYAITKEDFRSCYASANNNLTITIGGEEKHLAEEAPNYPNEVKNIILNYRSTSWTKAFKASTVISKVTIAIKKAY